MGIYVMDFRELIIKPCLQTLGDYSDTAEQLLAATAAQESQFVRQSPQAQGLGIYRISAEKHLEIWDKYLIQHPELASCVRGFASQQQFLKNPHAELIGNLNYATAIAWMIYRANGAEMNCTPEVNNLAQIWATNYNNGTGSARNIEDFIDTYRNSFPEIENHKLVA